MKRQKLPPTSTGAPAVTKEDLRSPRMIRPPVELWSPRRSLASKATSSPQQVKEEQPAAKLELPWELGRGQKIEVVMKCWRCALKRWGRGVQGPIGGGGEGVG